SQEPLRIGITDAQFCDAVLGSTMWADDDDTTVRQIEAAAAFFTDRADANAATGFFHTYIGGWGWTEMLGHIGGLGWRAVSAASTAQIRRTLRQLLTFWADSPLIEPDWKRGVQVHKDPKALVAESGRAMPVHIYMNNYTRWDVSDWEHPHSFIQRGDLTVPGRTKREDVQNGWATPERVHELLSALDARGPVPFDPKAAEILVSLTDLKPPAAAMLLGGLPCLKTHGRNFLPAEVRKTLRLRVSEAYDARTYWQRLYFHDLRWLELYDLAMPDDPARLWDGVFMAERLAAQWNSVGFRYPGHR
ncbi:MAG: hypothetical protein ACRD0P_10680, partial [Stackebrandtia sp.]